MLSTSSITVLGKVQGVYYRQSAKNKAQHFNITGTVKNLNNGSVLIIATGEDEDLQAFINWCKQGPISAVVAEVAVTPAPLTHFSDFQIVR